MVDMHLVDMNGTRQRFKHGIALILNQHDQVTGADRQQPSWEDDKDGEHSAISTVKRNLTKHSSLYRPGQLKDIAKDKARATHVEIVITQATWVTICTTVDKQPDDGRHQDMHTL